MMYKRIPPTFDCLQWTGDVAAITAWSGTETKLGDDGELYIDVANGGIIAVLPDYWVIKNVDTQAIDTAPPDFFASHYEAVPALE